MLVTTYAQEAENIVGFQGEVLELSVESHSLGGFTPGTSTLEKIEQLDTSEYVIEHFKVEQGTSINANRKYKIILEELIPLNKHATTHIQRIFYFKNIDKPMTEVSARWYIEYDEDYISVDDGIIHDYLTLVEHRSAQLGPGEREDRESGIFIHWPGKNYALFLDFNDGSFIETLREIE